MKVSVEDKYGEIGSQVSLNNDYEQEITIDSIASGKSAYFLVYVRRAGTPAEPFKAGTVRIKIEDETNHITKYFLVTINVAPGPYFVYTAAGNAAGSAISDITVTADVENKDNVVPGSAVTVTAPSVAGYVFAGWKALSPIDGSELTDVIFDNATAATTSFIMPSKNVSVVATYNVDTLNSIFIASPPTKTVYNVNDAFATAGMLVMAKYESGSTFTLASDDYTVSTPDMTTSGTKTITVTYNGKTATTNITVLPEDSTTYQVTYDANGGTGAMSADKATAGVLFTLPTCSFIPPAGYTFDKWQIGSTDYQLGQSVTIGANTTVKAIWKELSAEAVKVAVPTAKTNLVYTGLSQTGVESGKNYTLTGTTSAVDAGTYYAYAKLAGNKDGKTYYWEDGTTGLKLIEWTIAQAPQTQPAALEMDSRTTTSITLKTIAGAEYSMDGFSWQTSPEFTGLSSGTSYTFYARIPATADGNYSASEAVTATFSTLSAGGGSYTPTVQKPEITIIGSGKADLSADSRTAAISADEGSERVSITLNGKEVAKTDKLTGLKTGDKVVITFRKTAEDPAVIAKTLEEKVGKIQLIARSSKTAKKNIKVVLKTDAETDALIKDIQDMGYTVKYKFYRSTKKSASYKGMLTKTETRYFNTIGTKGTMYYYKARVMVYDKAGKLVTYSKLTQCKYANRMWSK